MALNFALNSRTVSSSAGNLHRPHVGDGDEDQGQRDETGGETTPQSQPRPVELLTSSASTTV